jgi:hypothetical protein
MSEKLNGANEPSLVRLYMSLTGNSESAARAVLMHVCGGENGETNGTNDGVLKLWQEQPRLSLSEPVQHRVGCFEQRLAVPIPA